MRRFEKGFVNGDRHSARVAERAVRRLQRTNPEPGQRLLDVGCGNGATVIVASRALGLQGVGVDVDPGQIETAQAAALDLAGLGFAVADATELPFADGEFNLVYTNKTTHHVRDWPKALSEMARVLRPGGYLVYSDFVAPFGHRFPTRPGIDRATAAAGLQRQWGRRSLFSYTACYRTAKGSAESELA